MIEMVPKDQLQTASRFRNLLGLYQKNADLISIGAYKKGNNPALDEAVSRISKMNSFLQQGVDESFSYEETFKLMESVVS